MVPYIKFYIKVVILYTIEKLFIYISFIVSWYKLVLARGTSFLLTKTKREGIHLFFCYKLDSPQLFEVFDFEYLIEITPLSILMNTYLYYIVEF